MRRQFPGRRLKHAERPDFLRRDIRRKGDQHLPMRAVAVADLDLVPVSKAVVNPTGSLFCISGSKVDRYHGFPAHSRGQAQKFIRPEEIRFTGVPCLIENLFSRFGWPDTIRPMVSRHKIPAGISKDREVEALQRPENIDPPSVRVSLTTGGVVQTTVDHAAEVLCKTAEQSRTYGADGAARIEADSSDQRFPILRTRWRTEPLSLPIGVRSSPT